MVWHGPYVVRNFKATVRPGTTDADIWREVFDGNCYRVSGFDFEDIVIDVGAHIGAFTCLCMNLGCTAVVAFEPDPMSFGICATNVIGFRRAVGLPDDWASLHNTAVWGGKEAVPLHLSHVPLLPGTARRHPAAQSTLFEHSNDMSVASDTLDSVLVDHARVRVLKLDCEGAEWPIIFSSQLLSRVETLCLEIHSLAWKEYEIGQPISPQLRTAYGKLSIDDFKARLDAVGFGCVRDDVNRCVLGNPEFYFGLMTFQQQHVT